MVPQDSTASIYSINICRAPTGWQHWPRHGNTGFKCPQPCGKRASAIVAVATQLQQNLNPLPLGKKARSLSPRSPMGDLGIRPGSGHELCRQHTRSSSMPQGKPVNHPHDSCIKPEGQFMSFQGNSDYHRDQNTHFCLSHQTSLLPPLLHFPGLASSLPSISALTNTS